MDTNRLRARARRTRRLELGPVARLRGSRLLYPQRPIACPPAAEKR